MWSCLEKPIPKYQIEREHRRIIEEGFANLMDTGVISKELVQSLEWFERSTLKPYGYWLMRTGLSEHCSERVREGFRIVQREWR